MAKKKYVHNAEEARNVITFLESLTHTKGKWAGQQFKTEKWQKDILKEVYGTLDENGNRKIRVLYVEIPRKNGKTYLAAGLALYSLFVLSNNDPESEIYSAAADKDQASLVFKQAASMVRHNKTLSKRCKIYDPSKRIVNYKTNSFYTAIAADAASAHGYNASCVIVDELHTQRDRHLVDTLVTSVGAREQPLLIFLTTAGFDQNTICWEYHEYARQVKEGIIEDPNFKGVVFSADPEDDWQSEKTWKKANPNYGISIKKEFLQQEAKRAKNVPAFQNTFKRLYLNMWTQQEDRFIDMAEWEANGGELDLESLKGRNCYAGLDLSTRLDITAFVLLFPDGEGGMDILPYFWLPEENLTERVRSDNVPYDLWHEQGFLKLTSGNVVDYREVRNDIVEIGEQYQILEIAYDKWESAYMIQELQDDGFVTMPVRQGIYTMSPPTKEFASLIAERQCRHGDNPILKWMADCLTVRQDISGNVRPVKPDRQKSTKRIDGIVALIFALDRVIRHEGLSAYDERELVVL